MKAELKKLAGYLPAPVQRVLSWTLAGLRRLRFALVRPYLLATRAWRRRKLAEIAASKQPVVLFLAPEAGLLPYYASHVIFARTLNESGHTAIMLSCDGLMPICPVKFAMQMKPTVAGDRANAACMRCRERALRIGHEYALVDVPLEALIGPKERVLIDDIIATNRATPWELTYDGVAFGAAALGETLRDRRKLEIDEFTEEDFELLNALLYASLAVYLAVDILSERYSLQKIVYFADYAYWMPPQILAQRKGISISRLEHAYNLDVDRRLVAVRPGQGNAHLWSQLDQWPEYGHIPITPDAVRNIADSSLFRLYGHGGTSTYSPNWVKADKNFVSQFGLDPDRKTIVAYTSSSDELICVQKFVEVVGEPYGRGAQPFVDQVEWLRVLVDWVATQPELQLIVRQHPRMAPAQRHPSVASQYWQMLSEFAALPENVVMIWPESKVSSYNLAEIADVAAVSWSNIGLELARFGVPVVASFPNIAFYPFGTFATSSDRAENYLSVLRSAIDRSSTVETVTEAFRWTYFAHLSPVVDISDLVPTPNYDRVPRWRMPQRRHFIESVLAENADSSRLNMASLATGVEPEAAERQAMLEALQRFLVFFDSERDQKSLDGSSLSKKMDQYVALGSSKAADLSPLTSRLVTMLRAPTSAKPKTLAF
jgi:hypothetical protein